MCSGTAWQSLTWRLAPCATCSIGATPTPCTRPVGPIDDPAGPLQFERYLVHLYAAPDRYMLEPCRQLAEAELRTWTGTSPTAQGSLALTRTWRPSRPSESLPAPHLPMGHLALRQVVPANRLNGSRCRLRSGGGGGADLEGIAEKELFLCVEWLYKHQSMSKSAAREKVTDLLRRIETRLMTHPEVREVVEPRGSSQPRSSRGSASRKPSLRRWPPG
jgi:hypothetical protein